MNFVRVIRSEINKALANLPIGGEKGDKGDKGDTGETGLQGEQGIQGIQGTQGIQGVAGSDADVTEHESTYNHNLLHDEAHNHDTVYEAKNSNIQTHVASDHAPSDAQKNSDITKAEIEAKLIGEISSHNHAGGGGNSTIIWLGDI